MHDGELSGVVYLGHIPHGFFEQEMRTYFSQFGNVNRLKLSRSKKVWVSDILNLIFINLYLSI